MKSTNVYLKRSAFPKNKLEILPTLELYFSKNTEDSIMFTADAQIAQFNCDHHRTAILVSLVAFPKRYDVYYFNLIQKKYKNKTIPVQIYHTFLRQILDYKRCAKNILKTSIHLIKGNIFDFSGIKKTFFFFPSKTFWSRY